MFLGINDDNKKIMFLKHKTYPNPDPCPKVLDCICLCVNSTSPPFPIFMEQDPPHPPPEK